MLSAIILVQLLITSKLVDGNSIHSPSHVSFTPVALNVGHEPKIPVVEFHEFTLNSTAPLATLDYGTHVAGLPLFKVTALSGPCEVELKYSEQFSGLHEPLSDGPSTFVSSLANSYRLETFNLTTPGWTGSSLLQGGQRWQTLRLLTNGTVTFRRVSFKSTARSKTNTKVTGTFNSSNTRYNKIWNLGAHAISLACFDEGTQRSIWNVSHGGALISSSVPSYTAAAYNFSDYTLEFDAKIVRGGLQWSMGYNFGIRSRGGMQLNLVGNYPAETTFKNTNKTLFPPSTVTLGYGVAFANQTTLTSYLLDTFGAPFEIQEGTWYRISSTTRAGNLTVAINDRMIFNVSLSDYYVGDGASISTYGSFGFGAWQDQSGLFRDVVVKSSTGSMIYENSLTNSTQVLPEYGVHENFFSTCVDGGRRDRLVWSGDFLHTVRIIGATTGRADQIKGTFSQLLAYQLGTGQFPMSPSLGYAPSVPPNTFAVGGGLGDGIYLLPDYHILALISFVSYMQFSNDVEFAKSTWVSLRQAVDWLIKLRSNDTGLIDFSIYHTAFLGPPDGVAVNAAAVEALSGMSLVASAVGDNSSAGTWRSISESLKDSINSRFWNDKSGFYSVSTSKPDDFSVAGTAFAITSGVSNKSQALASLDNVSRLRLGPGFKDATTVDSNDPTANISPNTNGFLFPALLQYGQVESARFLFENLWDAMIANDETYSGASWEYVNQERNPGLGQYTSLSHPWGGAATYAMSQYVAGIRPVEFGFKTWVVEPAYMGFDLGHVESTMPTPYGAISMSLVFQDTYIMIKVKAPQGTKGEIRLRQFSACPHKGCFQFKGATRQVSGGSSVQFKFHLV